GSETAEKWVPAFAGMTIGGSKGDSRRPKPALIHRETVEQAVAAGAAQIGRAAAAVGAARGVRGIPRARGVVVAQALAINMADDRGALRTARPVLAGLVVARREGLAVRRRAGQRVVLVRRIAAAVDDVAFLGQRGLLGQVVGAVQLV